MQYVLIQRDKGVGVDTFGLPMHEGEINTPPGEQVKDLDEKNKIDLVLQNGHAELLLRERTGGEGLDEETYRVLATEIRHGLPWSCSGWEPEAYRQTVAVDVVGKQPMSERWAASLIGTMLGEAQAKHRETAKAGPEYDDGGHEVDRFWFHAAMHAEVTFATAPYSRPLMIQLERAQGAVNTYQPLLGPPGMTKERALELVAEIAAVCAPAAADGGGWATFVEQLEIQGFVAPEQVVYAVGAGAAG